MLILDFDGTLTDAEEEGASFTEGCLEDLVRLTGWSITRVRQRADEIRSAMLANPTVHAWSYDGQLVAPATVDPYLRIKPIAAAILNEAGVAGFSLETLYADNYSKSGICFRPGALELMYEIFVHEVNARVVTNSATKPVQDKIRRLGMDLVDQYGTEFGARFVAWWMDRVHGGAKKYVARRFLSEEDTTPLELRIPGLDRPVLCKRPHYFELLKGLVIDRGFTWGQLTVIGDVFELDGALPLALGARVGLMAGPTTPSYEIDFLRAHPTGRVLSNLHEILPFYRE